MNEKCTHVCWLMSEESGKNREGLGELFPDWRAERLRQEGLAERRPLPLFFWNSLRTPSRLLLFDSFFTCDLQVTV